MEKVTIEFQHNLEVSIGKFLDSCDETQLNTILIETDRRLRQIDMSKISENTYNPLDEASSKHKLIKKLCQ